MDTCSKPGGGGGGGGGGGRVGQEHMQAEIAESTVCYEIP